MNITENFINILYQETIPNLAQAGDRRIPNVGSKELPDITIEV